MRVARFDERQRLAAGLAAVGGALCVAVLPVGEFLLLRPRLLTAVLAAMLGISAVVLLWQRHTISRSSKIQRLQRAVIDSSPNAVITSDAGGWIIGLNPAAERLFLKPEGSAGQLRMSELIAPTAEVGNAPAGGNVLDLLGQRMVVDGRRADGTLFPAEISVLRVGSGLDTMFAAYIRDLTEQRRAHAAQEAHQERVHQAEKLSAMGSLLGGVAHELNNPLAILVTQATLLREKAPTPDVERRAERIHAAAQRAGRIVKSFLAMARQKAPVRSPTALNGVIENALEFLGYGLRSAGIVVDLDLAPDLPSVDADRDLMGQVFANVLINAQQALVDRPEPRRIAVRSFRRNGEVVAEVTDNGPGIAADIRDRIFEPYFTTKPVGAGTGIGLSVCRTVVTGHAGVIEAVPAAEGTTIVIRLPVSGPRPASTVRPRSDRGLSILVVDDEVDVAESLAELMDIFGHRAVVMSSAMDALDRVKEQVFDAVFTDLRMPGMSGLSLRQAIRAVDADLGARTVIMTGDTVMGFDGDGRGDDGLVLEKPFTAETVRSLIDRVRAR